MIIRYLLFIISFLFQQTLLAQSVWPGDVNNNGEVNKVDLIYLGFAYGETGAARTAIDGNWGAQELPTNWEGNFPNGLNFAYADCNGDGVVNQLDVEVISSNLELTHDDVPFVPDNIIPGIEGEDPKCGFVNPPGFAPVDQLFNLEIGLGDSDIPVDNFYGLSFVLNVDPDVVGLDNSVLTFNTDGWIEPGEESSIELTRVNELKAEYKVAFTRKDKMPISGAGPLATVSFVVEGDIVGFLVEDRDTITFTIDSIRVLNGDLETIPVVADTLKLEIREDMLLNAREHPTLRSIELYPNPNRGLLLIKSSEAKLEKVELVNALGQIVFKKDLKNITYQSLDIQHLERGCYWLRLYSPYGIKTESIQKL